MEIDSKYPKIQTLYKRDDQGKIIVGDYSMPEFETVRAWYIEEKVDGTNIRITFHRGGFTIKGKTDKADLKGMGIEPLLSRFAIKLFDAMAKLGLANRQITFYGEAYGGKIQSKAGQLYSPDANRFCLFDVYQREKGWWTRKEIMLFFQKCDEIHNGDCGIKSPPMVSKNFTSLSRVSESTLELAKWKDYEFSIDEISDFVKGKPFSQMSDLEQVAEGIIARPYDAMVYNRKGERIMFKLKVKDFQ